MIDLGNWARMDTMTSVGLPDLAVVYASQADIAYSKFDPASAGMRSQNDLLLEQRRKKTKLVEMPQMTDVGLAVNNPYEVRIVDNHDTELAGATFQDPHDERWIKKLAQQGRALLIVGPIEPNKAPTMGKFLESATLGIIPMAIYQFDDGIGIHASRPTT